jgi:hypothetical protein
MKPPSLVTLISRPAAVAVGLGLGLALGGGVGLGLALGGGVWLGEGWGVAVADGAEQAPTSNATRAIRMSGTFETLPPTSRSATAAATARCDGGALRKFHSYRGLLGAGKDPDVPHAPVLGQDAAEAGGAETGLDGWNVVGVRRAGAPHQSVERALCRQEDLDDRAAPAP